MRSSIKSVSPTQWIKEMLDVLKPYETRVVDHPVFKDIEIGVLPLKKLQVGLTFFYPLVEAFPQFMGLILAKVPAGDSERNRNARDWLINNIHTERRHSNWWKDWAVKFGVPANA